MTSNLAVPSEDHKDNAKIKCDEIENLIINDEISNIKKINEESNEGNKRDVDDDEGDTKIVRNVRWVYNYLMYDEINLNDTVDIPNDDSISNDKDSINNETIKKSTYSSIYSTHRKYNQIGGKDASARLDKTNIVYYH